MDNLIRLRAALRRTLEHEDSQGSQELYDALQVSAPALRRVGRAPAKNAEERREIEGGRTTHRNKALAVNADFARQALFVADHLSLSERAAASLLHDVAHTLPNATSVEIIEHAVAEFDRRRHASVDALLLLLQAARAAEDKGALPLLKRLDVFIRKEILSERPGHDALPLVVLAEIDATAQVLAQAQAVRTNAVSSTAIPTTTGGPGQLSHDVLDGRCKALAVHRRTLSGVLYLLSRMGALAGPHVQKLVDWLRTRPHDPSTYHVLSTLLVALQPPSRAAPTSSTSSFTSSNTASTDHRKTLLGDRALASHMRSTLSPGSTGWSEPGLKAALGLQWALFATDARRADAALEHVQGYTTDEVEAFVWAGAQGGSFTYLARLVRKAAPATFEAEEEMGVPVYGEQEAASPEAPEPEFAPAFLDALDVLVRTLVRHASSELRKIKQRQEDVVLASARADRSVRFSRSAGPLGASNTTDHTNGIPPRNDIATLFQLIGVLYAALPPERALQFWGAQPLASASDPTRDALAAAVTLETISPKLPAFVQWSAWSTHAADSDALAALCGMFAGLANGRHCAELAYNVIAHGAGEALPPAPGAASSAAPAISWAALFGMLETWATALSTPKPSAPQLANSFGAPPSLPRPQAQQLPQIVLGPKDVRLAQAFLRLLAAVVSHSVDARKAVAGHGAFRAIPALVTLLPLGVPLELKGALFGALSAFCAPGAGPAGAEICRAVWTLMERMEVISLRPAGTSTAGVRGVEIELEEVEAPYRLYPATIPFLRLLATLVHTPRRVRLATRLLDLEPANPLPEQLGAPYRTPGLGPFVAFVVDTVFVQISQREYLRPSDRWRMNDLCLCFIERCLAAYDLSALLTLADSTPLIPELLQPYVTHPGYDILRRILSDTPLAKLILSYVEDGVDGFDRGFATEEPLYRSTLVRVLRIVLRVLELQDAFLDVLVPLLAELDRTGNVAPRSVYTPFDQALSFAPQHAPALATYAVFPAHPELVLLSVQIMHRLARSPSFSGLAAAVERNADSERILAAYVRILDADSAQDVAEAEAVVDDYTGAGAPDTDDSLDLAQATQLTALELLLDGTSQSQSHPHLAHFILFGASRAESVENPQALGARLAGVHVIVEALLDGIPRIDTDQHADDGDADTLEPLFVSLPALAERQLRVIHQLCTHPRTAEFVSRYLRAREDFAARQLAVIPARAPAISAGEDEPFVDIAYGDGARARTTAPALGAFLQYRALVLDLVALELHTQTAKGPTRKVPELMRLLFTLDEEPASDELVPIIDESFRPFRELGQAHLRIIAQAHALDFDWSDSLAVAPVELVHLRGLRLEACVRVDSAGCEIVDQAALLAFLGSARRALQQQGRVNTQADADKLATEVAYVLESCAVENHRRELAHAQAAGFAAWRRVLDVALFKSFDSLAPYAQETVLFDVLHVLPRLLCSEHLGLSTRALLAEAVVSCVAKLREDRAQRIVSGAGITDVLPAERLHALLRSLVVCVLDPSQGPLVRGNLYAALVDYLQLVHEPAAPEATTASSQALSGAGMHALRKGSLAILKEAFSRLINTVAGDALDGAEVWKTVAFVLLDALVELAGGDLSNAALTTLVRTGMLANFVQSIRRDDERLQTMLVPDPDDLNALYVYEAQMSLLIRVAQSRQGAERLQEFQVLPILSGVEYVDCRPEDVSLLAEDIGFVPPALSRYHQLLMPVLQLVGSILGSLSSAHVTAGNQALEFFVNHRNTIAVLLRTNNDPASLMALREVHMVVHICNLLLPRIAKSELASSITGYGSIHAAILSVASTVLKGGLSSNDFQPQSEAEYIDSQTTDLDGSSTRFDVAVQTAKAALHQALAAYLGAASEFTEPELCLVLSPDTSITSDRTSRWSGVPSVVDAVHALEEVGRRLSGTFMRLAELSAELCAETSAMDHSTLVRSLALSRSRNVQQPQPSSDPQRWQLHQRTSAEAKTLAYTLETILLLLWRHLAVYIEKEDGISLSIPTSFAQSTRGVVNYDTTSFHNEVVRQVQAALQPLSNLHMDEHEPTWRAHGAYIDIMAQRLREVLKLS